ncbi:MAG: hypothetical protein CVU41_17385 [Chloroflexi bacterium HGW-Chloroflexi-3]|nr:MAG: hypothetical protein CVU41_17385 [Chloroflexi bacterium HGW-Chloroflexi-3]
MKPNYRVILSILILISMLGALFTNFSIASSQEESPYHTYLPLIFKNIIPDPPSYFSTTWYVTLGMLQTMSTGQRNIYYKGVHAGNLTAPAGRQDQLVILHFGRPRKVDTQIGTRVYFDTSGEVTSIKDIIIYTKDFINGYMVGALANNDTESKLDLGVGTSNLNYEYWDEGVCLGYFCTTEDAYNHGKAWAQMVITLNDWVKTQGYASRVSVAGASDIELAWNSALISHAWVKGFDDYDQGKYIFYNFGACEGCDIGINLTKPPDPYKDLTGDWTHAKVHYSAWGAPPAWPIPEIYLNNGYNANQWANISKVGVMLGYVPIYFFSPLSQYQACLGNNDPSCPYMDNTPQEAWIQLYKAINARPETAQKYIPYMTDIDWP